MPAERPSGRRLPWFPMQVASQHGPRFFPFISDGSDGFYIAWHDDRDNNMLASTWVNHVNSEGVVQFPDQWR